MAKLAQDVSEHYAEYLVRCKAEKWRGSPKPEVKSIPLSVWEPVPGQPKGYIRRVRGRTVGEVAADIEAAAEQHELSVEYMSTGGLDPVSEFPKGEGFIAIENGGNEGYSLMVYCKVDVLGRVMHGSREIHICQVIRAKLLRSAEDVFKLYRVIWDLLDE